MPLPLGLVTPIVSMNPRVAAPWEATAAPEDLVAVAGAAAGLGFPHLTCSEHVAVPPGATSSTGTRRGTRYYDPAVTLGWLAASTDRVRLATHVLVAGHHHPLEVVKTYGTLDVLSRGRVVLGVGVGSLREEFDALGVPFAGRGERADDLLRAVRAAWGRPEPRYDGPVFSFGGMVVDPCATTTEPTVWVGGRTARSLRRAVELGDGWVPFGLSDEQLASLLAGTDRRAGFALVLAAEDLDPVGGPRPVGDRLEALVRLGATIVDVRVRHRSRAHLLEQLEAVAAVAAAIDAPA